MYKHFWQLGMLEIYLNSLVYEGYQSSVADSTSVLIVDIKT